MTLDGTSTEVESETGITAHVGGVDWRTADQMLRRIAKRRARLDVEEARWLLVAQRTGAHVRRGCATFLEYLERVLGYAPRSALDRMRVASALERMPRLRRAMEAGALGFSAVRELTRVIEPETEDDWVDLAIGRTVREVEAMVSGHKPGDRPTDEPDDALRPRDVRMKLLPETCALLREARRAIAAEVGHAVDDDEAMCAMARAAIARGTAPASWPRHQIAVTTCPHCRRGWQDGAGVTVAMTPAAIATAECDATRIDDRGHVTDDIPNPTRRLVLRRDHGRCVVPGCRSTRHLDVHHIVFREHGGGHEPENLTCLCAGHHRQVHAGRLAITGRAPSVEVRFIGSDAPPRPSEAELDRLAVSGLVNAGFKRPQALAAVALARAHVGAEPTLDELLTAALRAAPKPQCQSSSGPSPRP